MSNQTPMDDLLKTPADEVERSPDTDLPEQQEQVEAPKTEAKVDPKPEPKTEPKSDAGDKDPPDGETEEASTRRMHALPKWAHERMRANDEKAAAAERRAAELERKAAEAAKTVEDWNRWYQEQTGEEQAPAAVTPQYDPAQQTAEAIYQTRLALGLDRANEKYGPEYTEQASLWARDRMQADRGFWQGMLNAPDPVGFAIREFKKSQTESELEKYGFDIDALVKARTSQQQPQAPSQAHTGQPAAGASGASRPSANSMPGDFASQPSGGGRAEPVFSGPTPLGDLLKIKR